MGVATDAAQARVKRGAGMSLPFSPLQQRCLDALGYTRYALAGADTASALARLRMESSAPPGSMHSTSLAAPAAQDLREHRLLLAVLKASRLRLDTIGDPQQWLAARGVASIAALRGNPTAKRALWAMLRRQRRTP